MASMGKRGDLAARQIILSVIVILGFAIALWFVTRLGIDEQSKSQLCHFSVLTRAGLQSSAASAATRGYLPLNCKAQNVCVGESGACRQAFAGEKAQSVRVEQRKGAEGEQETARALEGAIAEQMYSCWAMMGEGKLDLFQGVTQKFGLTPSKDPICVICSRIALDVAKEKEQRVLDMVDVPAYLRSHRIPDGSKTYLEAFTEQRVQSYARVDEEKLRALPATPTEESVLSFVPQQPEFVVLFSQIKPVSFTQALTHLGNAGATLAGGSFVLAPVKTTALAGRVASVVLSIKGIAVLAGGAAVGAAYVGMTTQQSKLAAAGYCGELASPEESQTGCSVVQVVPYDARVINELCTYREGKL